MENIKKLLIGVLVFLLFGCATGGGGILKKAVIQNLSSLQKRNIRCYVDEKKENVLVSSMIEGCRQVFTVVKSRPYDIKVVPQLPDYKLDVVSEKCKRDGSLMLCDGTYRLELVADIKVFDANNKLIKTLSKRDGAMVDTYAMASGHRNNTEVAKSRAYRNGAGKANTEVMNRIVPEIIRDIYSDENIIAVEKNLRQSPKGVAEARTLEQKIPFTCVLSLPAGFESATARALFKRTFHINKETQAGAIEINIGKKLKSNFIKKLENEFSQVQVKGLKGESLSATYNPHNVVCIVKLDYQGTEVEKVNNSVTINASVTFETPTGEAYKATDLTGRGTAKLKKGGGFMSKVMLGVSLTRLATEGHYMKKAFKNGCDEAIKETTEKLVAAIDPDFIRKFSEFAAYTAAKKSRASNDIQHFLSLYPQSKYATELNALQDDVLYEFAVGSDSIEGYMDYLNQMPQGKNRLEAKNKLGQLIYEQIAQGNTAFCEIYKKYNLSGGNINVIKKVCAQN